MVLFCYLCLRFFQVPVKIVIEYYILTLDVKSKGF